MCYCVCKCWLALSAGASLRKMGPVPVESARASRGGTAFAQAGCAACHRPELKIDPNWRFPRLAGQTIRLYTDPLVHDMGNEERMRW